MIMSTDTPLSWTPAELDYLLSLSDLELQTWLTELSSSDQRSLMQRLLERHEEKTKQATEDLVSSKSKLAPLVGMSLPMLERYIGQGARIEGPPYSVVAAKEEIEKLREATDVDREEVGSLRRERLRAELAERMQSARSKELRNDILEGKFYKSEEVDQYLCEYAARIKSRLEQIPAEVAVEMPGEWRDKIRVLIEDSIRNLLLELAGMEFETS